MSSNGFETSVHTLRSISPTQFIGMRACALKEAWALSGNSPLLPSSPRAQVGSIVHRLLTDAGMGSLPADQAAIQARWEDLVEEAQTRLGHSWIDGHLVPLERSVPDIEVTRIRSVNRALEIALHASREAPHDSESGQVPGYGYELSVRSKDGLVRGVVDAAVPSQGGPVLQDYKSGAIFEGDVDALHLKEAYTIQLKMYAALYSDFFGRWPSRLEVVPITGEVYKVTFEKAQCVELVNEAKATLAKVNSAIETCRRDLLATTLANPDPANCRYCQFRPACGPYLSRPKESGAGWPIDFFGRVEAVRRLGNSKIMLQVSTADGIVSIPGLSTGERHPGLKTVQAGDSIGVFGLHRSRPNAPCSESILTTVHRLSKTPYSQVWAA